MKIVLVDSHLMKGRDFKLERDVVEGAGFEFELAECHSEDEVLEKCADADGLMVIYLKMGEKVAKGLKKCQVWARYGIGYDNFDVDAATAEGIKVCNIPHYCVPEVATHTTAMILELTRHLREFDADVKAGKWLSDQLEKRVVQRPVRQWVGLAGFGEIGRTVAGQLKAIGFNVMAYDPYQPDSMFEQLGVRQVELDTLLEESDILSIHMLLDSETRYFVNKDTLARMKDGVILINTARGGVIDEADLLEALNSGKVAAAGLDVLNEEPINEAALPLARHKNVLITPHVAFRSEESFVALCEGAATAASSVLLGKIKGNLPFNIVNRKQLGL